MSERIVIFTDLDGTLLDHDTYSFDAALPALGLVRELGVPLVLTSSKTRAEIEEHRQQLGNSDPFISENGGGVFIPLGYFSLEFEYTRESRPCRVIELGSPHSELTRALERVREGTGLAIRGMSEMTVDEVIALTGLEESMATLARMREYDEPFVVDGPLDTPARKALGEAIEALGYRLTEGGRLFHITGGSDKGLAVSTLAGLFARQLGPVTTVGLGDSPNDVPMLEAVNVPVLVQKPDGTWDERVDIEGMIMAEGAGPAGWCAAVLEILHSHKTGASPTG